MKLFSVRRRRIWRRANFSVLRGNIGNTWNDLQIGQRNGAEHSGEGLPRGDSGGGYIA